MRAALSNGPREEVENQKQTTSVKENHVTMDCVDVEQIGEYCPGVSD
jgi:hypothetical protein